MTLKKAIIEWKKKRGYVPKEFKIDHHENCGYWWRASCNHSDCTLISRKGKPK